MTRRKATRFVETAKCVGLLGGTIKKRRLSGPSPLPAG
jgi:hypothetical protein